MRTITFETILEETKRMCIEANYRLTENILKKFEEAKQVEASPLGKEILQQLIDNARIAREEDYPICQDTGDAVFFIELGQDVRIEGGGLIEAINKGVAQGYREGFLRFSMVEDPLRRKNTGDNTPAMVTVQMVPGDRMKMSFLAKGGGCENMSAFKMLTPADGVRGVKEFVANTVKNAGGNPCPPVVVGVGVGGTFDQCCMLAKKALFREVELKHPDPYYAQLETELLGEINKLGITFGPPEIENRVNAIVVCSPDKGVSHPFEGSGFVLDRPKFGRRLLSEALKTGIEYSELTQATDLLIEGNFVAGIVCQQQSGNETRSYKVTSRLVIDASGMSTKLRRNLRIPSFIEKEIDRDDIEPTIRLNARLADGLKVDTTRCEIYLDAERAPGGYLWVFPKASDKVNVGLGVQQKRASCSLENLLRRWIDETPLFKGMTELSDDGNRSGAWPVSVRHQNDCLVANGFMLAGDSGWFPNPISAGGIGPAMTGGVITGEVAARALESDDLGEKNLWDYNVRYVEKYGNKTAALEAFRIYLQSLDNSGLNYGMRNFVTHEEAVGFTWGEVPELSLADKILKVVLGLRKPRAFRGLAYSISKMNELNQLYREYPRAPSRFVEWKKKVDGVLNAVRVKFR